MLSLHEATSPPCHDSPHSLHRHFLKHRYVQPSTGEALPALEKNVPSTPRTGLAYRLPVVHRITGRRYRTELAYSRPPPPPPTLQRHAPPPQQLFMLHYFSASLCLITYLTAQPSQPFYQSSCNALLHYHSLEPRRSSDTAQPKTSI